jgi:DNA primase
VKDAQGYFFERGEKERHEDHSKYMSLPGDKSRLYNTPALIEATTEIAVVEGELSAWAVVLDGVPAVAIQGVSAWKDYFDGALIGYEKVYLLGDGDEPGRQLNQKLAERLPNSVPVRLPDGEDPDSYRREQGDGIIRGLLGKGS